MPHLVPVLDMIDTNTQGPGKNGYSEGPAPIDQQGEQPTGNIKKRRRIGENGAEIKKTYKKPNRTTKPSVQQTLPFVKAEQMDSNTGKLGNGHQADTNMRKISINSLLSPETPSESKTNGPSAEPRRRSPPASTSNSKSAAASRKVSTATSTTGRETPQDISKSVKVEDSPTFTRVDKPPQHLLLPRLHIREFIVRFESRMDIPKKHINILTNPFIAAEYLSFRHLTCALLKLIDFADEPAIPQHEIKTILATISKAPEHSTILWDSISDILSKQKEVNICAADPNDSEEINHLYLITRLIDFTVSGEYVRYEVEDAAEEARRLTFAIVKERAAKRQDYERQKATMHKKRIQITQKADVAHWQEQWNIQAEKWKTKARKYEIELIEIQQSNQVRTRPFGVDCLGNTYWQFSRRPQLKPEDDLGCRIIIETRAGIPHPTKNESSSTSRDYAWFEITDAESATQLVKWIGYIASTTLDAKPKPVENRAKEIKSSNRRTTTDSIASSDAGDLSITNEDDDSAAMKVQITMPTKRGTPPLDLLSDLDRATNQQLLDQWSQIETLQRRITEFARYLISVGQ